MTGVPTVQILLDNFTGSFPYDITQYVELSEGITWNRGRQDEFDNVSAGQMTLTLDNTDGRFSFANATYGGMSTSQKIRAIVNGTTRFTGRIQELPVGWPGGGQPYSSVQITALDDWARLATWPLRSSIEEDILVDNPSAYYTLGEAQGATQAADSSGDGAPSLTVTGTGSAVVFGNGTGPVDGLSAVQMAGGQYLATTASATPFLGPSAWSVEFWINVAAPPASIMGLFTTDTSLAAANINTSGQVVSGMVGPNVCDGLTHQIVVTNDGTTQTLYVDGASVGTAAIPSVGTAGQLSVGITTISPTVFSGTMSHFATYTSALSAARVLAHWTAGHSDYSGETPQARITRIAGYTGTPVGTLDTAGSTLCGPAVQQGMAAADVLNDVASATLGVVYINGSGALASVNGYTMAGNTTADSTLDGQWLSENTTVMADMQNVINKASGKATRSENPFYYADAFQISVHGAHPQDFEWNVSTDDQARDRTAWMVKNYAGPNPRMPELEFDLLSMDATTLAQAFTLDLGKYLHLANLPSQTPSTLTVNVTDLIVQGMTETITADAWTVSVTCVRRNLFWAWVLDDPLLSKLDTFTKLFVG